MKKSKRMTIREKRNKTLLTLATVGEAFYMEYMKGGVLEAVVRGVTELSKAM